MKKSLLMLCSLAWAASAQAASNEPDPMAFHRAVYALQQKQIANRTIRTEQEPGKYEGAAAAKYRYLDTRYYDAATGLLLSRVRRDADNPKAVHIVEVNIYEKGKLVRDYGSISMPWAPQVPERTMINLHHYNGELHSFRQFDVYGDVSSESCEGKFKGKKVRLYLEAGDINETSAGTPVYKACFEGMSKNAESYLTPH